MEQFDSLPISVSQEQRGSQHIMSGIAQRAFRLAGFDFAPDNAIEVAISRGMVTVTEQEELPDGGANPMSSVVQENKV